MRTLSYIYKQYKRLSASISQETRKNNCTKRVVPSLYCKRGFLTNEKFQDILIHTPTLSNPRIENIRFIDGASVAKHNEIPLCICIRSKSISSEIMHDYLYKKTVISLYIKNNKLLYIKHPLQP